MICNIILIVAAAFVSVQPLAIQPNVHTPELELTTIIDGLYKLNGHEKAIESILSELSEVFPAPEKALLHLKTLIDESLNNATIQLKNQTINLARRAQATVVEANSTLYQEAKSLLEEVAVLESESEALGVNAVHCTQGTSPSIDKLPSKYSGRLNQCKGDKVVQGQNVIKSAQNTLATAYAIIQHFTDDLKLCETQTGVRVKLCRARVGVNIVKTTESLPVDMSKVVSDSGQLINSLYSEVQICTLNVNTHFLNRGKQIIDDIERCIDEEINFKSTN